MRKLNQCFIRVGWLTIWLTTILLVNAHTSYASDQFVVSLNSDEGGQCASGVPSNCTLRQALASAQNDDVIMIDPTLQHESITLINGPLEIKANVTIDGTKAPGIIVDAKHKSIAFMVDSGVSAAIGGLIIQNGQSTLNGGGLINNGTLNLSNDTFTANQATSNGGGVINNGTLTIIDSTLNNNQAINGAGIFNTGSLSMSNSTIDNNKGTSGAGIYNAGLATITNATVSYNYSVLRASGIVNDGMLSLGSSLIADNGIDEGGFIDLDHPDYEGTLNSFGYNWINDGTGAQGITDGKLHDHVGTLIHLLDPKIADLKDNGGNALTRAIANDSPVAGQGLCNWPSIAIADPPVISMTTDERGVPRKFPCDIGAFEIPEITMRLDSDTLSARSPSVGADYTWDIGVQGGTWPYQFVKIGGSLPTGTQLNSDKGLISGVLTAPGSFTFTILLIDANKHTAQQTFTVTVYSMSGSTIMVTDDRDPGMPNCADPNQCSLRTAVMSATNGDVITFSPKLAHRSIKLDGNSISSSVSYLLDGTNAPGITIDGNHVTQVVLGIDSGMVVFKQLTIKNAVCPPDLSEGGGGGTFSAGIVNNGTLMLDHVIVSDNKALCEHSDAVNNTGILIVDHSLITRNGGPFGSGCGIDVLGGAYSTDPITPTVTIVRNSTIFNNRRGICNGQGTLEVENSTIYGNLNGGIDSSDSYFTLVSSIVASNHNPDGSYSDYAQDIVGTVHSLGYNLIGDSKGSIDLVNGQNHDQVGSDVQNASLNPKLGGLQDNGGFSPTLTLLPESPAIGKGFCADNPDAIPILAAITTDQRGMPRKADCDVGAFEAQP